MLESIRQLLKNRKKISQGIINSVFIKSIVEKIAKERIAICRSNECGYYDPLGASPKAFIRGKEACAQCGCNLHMKVRSLSSACSLQEEGKEPFWKAELTTQEEDSLNNPE